MNPRPTDAQHIMLDYSSLALPVTPDEIKAVREQLKNDSRKNMSRTVQILIMVLVLIFMTPFIIAMGVAFVETRSVWPLVAVVLFFVITGVIIYYNTVVRPRYFVRLYRFARANKLTVIHNVGDPSYSGMIFDEGHSRQIREALQFLDGLEIGNYQYVTGSGKHRQTHNYAYAKVPLGRHLPHIVLDSLQNNFLGMSNLPDTFTSDQRLELEGDFNKHFRLYAPKEYERDALYIFTPDVMATMLDNGERYDMEIVDNMLFIYSQLPIDLLSSDRLEPLLEVVNKIGGDVSKQSTRYSDERVADRAQDVVADPGKRLKKGLNLTVTAIVVGVIFLQIAPSFWPDAALYGWAVIGLIVVGLLIKQVRG